MAYTAERLNGKAVLYSCGQEGNKTLERKEKRPIVY